MLAERFPDLRKFLFTDIAALFIKKTAYLHLSLMADKGEALTSHTALAHSVKAVGLRGYLNTLLLFTLPEYPVVVRSAGRLKLYRHLLSHIVEPAEGLLIVLRANLLILKVRSPAGRHEQEGMVRLSAELYHEI